MDGKLHANIVCPVEVEEQPEKTLPDLQSTQFAIDFINNYNISRGVPFFLSVGFNKPHIPLKFPKEYLDLYPLSTINLAHNRYYPMNFPEVAYNPWMDLKIREDVKHLNLSFPFGKIPDYFQKYIRQSYYASTTYIDDLIGRILFALNEKKLSNNTIILLIGDHGWSLGEHNEWSKYSNFDVALKVPLIIAIPNNNSTFRHISPFINNNKKRVSKKYRISKELIELVDIFPTLCDLTGLLVPPICQPNSSEILCTEGLSMKPIIEKFMSSNKTIIWKSAVFSQYPRPSPTTQLNSDQPMLKDIRIMGYSMRTPYLRYTEWIGFDHKTVRPKWSQVFARELYFDKKQNMNRAYDQRFAQIIKFLSKQLKNGWRTQIITYNQFNSHK